MSLQNIPEDQYSAYRYEVIFRAYKWDPQVEDHNTVSRQAVILDPQTAVQLETWAEQLSMETMEMEEAFLQKPYLVKDLGLPAPMRKIAEQISDYQRERHIRFMRFDFHPTKTGWAVSELNSDVPGGVAEASILPVIASQYIEGCAPGKNVADYLCSAFQRKAGIGGRIAFVHATSYADDRQVMQCLGDCFRTSGFTPLFAAPDHIQWRDRRAYSILEGEEGELDGLLRFYPLEWLPDLPKKRSWKGNYDCITPSCNHPISIFTQTKRLPLVWDQLGVDISGWNRLLPATVHPASLSAAKVKEGNWIYKPALGRVGEGISIPEAVTAKDMQNIHKAVRRHPKEWVAQERFQSKPIMTATQEALHLCIGVFTVDGRSAGFYGRVSPYPRIDSRARDIPVLIAASAGNQSDRI